MRTSKNALNTPEEKTKPDNETQTSANATRGIVNHDEPKNDPTTPPKEPS